MTTYVPVVPVQERVELAEFPRITLLGLRVQERPVEGEMLVVNATDCSTSPFSDVTAIVEFPLVPETIVSVVGLAETPKSWTVKITVAEWVRAPLIAVTVAR